jgi:hypothetical protein
MLAWNYAARVLLFPDRATLAFLPGFVATDPVSVGLFHYANSPLWRLDAKTTRDAAAAELAALYQRAEEAGKAFAAHMEGHDFENLGN